MINVSLLHSWGGGAINDSICCNVWYCTLQLFERTNFLVRFCMKVHCEIFLPIKDFEF